MARVLFIFGLATLHLSWVFFNCGQGIVYVWLGWFTFSKSLLYLWFGCCAFIGSCSLVARVFFNFGLVGQRVARVLSTIGPVALHLAWVLFIFG